jgi:hypothetical protein
MALSGPVEVSSRMSAWRGEPDLAYAASAFGPKADIGRTGFRTERAHRDMLFFIRSRPDHISIQNDSGPPQGLCQAFDGRLKVWQTGCAPRLGYCE